MYFQDLGAYRFYCSKQFVEVKEVKNVGWLQKDQPYSTGAVEDVLIQKLYELIFDPRVETNQTRGVHPCDLCQGEMVDRIIELTFGSQSAYLGTAEIWIPARDNTIFAAPTLIYHYVAEHSYQPPAAFVEAVLEFDPGSDWHGDTVRDALFDKYCRQG